MKVDIPRTPPKEVEFPDFVGGFHSNILIPYPLYIITTVEEHGRPDAQRNTWGLPFGYKFAQFFVFYNWASHHTIQKVITAKEFTVSVPSGDQVFQAMGTAEQYPCGVD
jgi:flavin reductase (DIM6/NTAB) family NADH-FMN oxidoreductase RutF